MPEAIFKLRDLQFMANSHKSPVSVASSKWMREVMGREPLGTMLRHCCHGLLHDFLVETHPERSRRHL